MLCLCEMAFRPKRIPPLSALADHNGPDSLIQSSQYVWEAQPQPSVFVGSRSRSTQIRKMILSVYGRKHKEWGGTTGLPIKRLNNGESSGSIKIAGLPRASTSLRQGSGFLKSVLQREDRHDLMPSANEMRFNHQIIQQREGCSKTVYFATPWNVSSHGTDGGNHGIQCS